MSTITLESIWTSSTGLLKRFGLMPSAKKSYLKFQEEIAELQEALFKLSWNRKNTPYKQDAAEEMADCIVTLLNIGYTAGLSCEDIEKALQKVIDKNDAKSEVTHVSDNGWIKRREASAMIEPGE